MGEFVKLLLDVKSDKEKFYLIMDKMEPIINRYAKSLYKDERDDIKSELMIALWQAVCNIKIIENDGQIVKYLSTAIKNRFFELYRNSCKYHDNEVLAYDEDYSKDIACIEKQYSEMIINEDIRKFLESYSGIKKDIYCLMLYKGLPDSEIANMLNLSRQYVNRMRKNLREEMLVDYIF